MTDATTPKNTGDVNAVLAYVLGPIYLLIEKKDKTLRFHALQATFLMVIWVVVNIIINALYLWFLSSLVGLGATALWIVLAFKAYQGEKVVLPIIGEYAEKYA